MHLTIVSPFPPAITGIGQYGYHVTRALAKSGLFTRVTVLASGTANAISPNHLGIAEVEYCWQPDLLNARQTILSRVKRLNPDLVWFNLGASVFGKSPWINVLGLLSPKFVQQMGIPTVTTLHELVELVDLRALNAPGGSFAIWGARLLTRITTNSDVTCLTMGHYAKWLAARHVDCMHIPIGAYHEPELLEETPTQELLFFTTLAPYKGLELLLDVFRVLQAEYPQLRLTIAGAEHVRFPNYAGELKARTCTTQGIQWLGQVAEDDVMDLFRRAQIVVLPYVASTGSSSVLYQAATWGRAIVASDLQEICALTRENNWQVEFFKTGDIESLRSAIRALLDSPARRSTQALHNFKSIQYSRPAETAHLYIEAFNRALAKRQSPQRLSSVRTKIESI